MILDRTISFTIFISLLKSVLMISSHISWICNICVRIYILFPIPIIVMWNQIREDNVKDNKNTTWFERFKQIERFGKVCKKTKEKANFTLQLLRHSIQNSCKLEPKVLIVIVGSVFGYQSKQMEHDESSKVSLIQSKGGINLTASKYSVLHHFTSFSIRIVTK